MRHEYALTYEDQQYFLSNQNRLHDGLGFAKEKFPMWNINRWVFIHGLMRVTSQYGVLVIEYEPKSDDQLFSEAMLFLINSNDPNVPIKPKFKRGHCPECGRKVDGYKPVFGSLAPEWWASMRENGIDPSTGHKIGCSKPEYE